jgi:hypothetical protein
MAWAHLDLASVLPPGFGWVDLHDCLPLDAKILGRLLAAACSVALSQAIPALLSCWPGMTGS